MEMETCVRGFSFMPKENVSTESLQYIEGEELTRKWRACHRERQRQREQRIWEEFVVKENDVLSTLCKDDPYQFLEQLPEDCLKELMDIQLAKMKQEKEEEEAKILELSQHGDGDSPSPAQDNQDVEHVVTFADEVDKEDEMFHIFDDKDDDKISGAEDEGTDSLSPSTVRERSDASPDSRALSPDKRSSKSSENVANVIENSIYFAKVKDLRNKMSEELANIVLSLERRDIMNIDPADLVKMCRRSSEFSARFNRVHMYQLKRQINDLERNNSVCLPFAKHTQFQAQMVRIASLHQNMLQAFQIFNKSIEQTGCVRESIETVRGLVAVCRRGLAASLQHLLAAGDLRSDNVIPSCDGLEEAINEYAAKLSSYMDSTENTHTSHSRRSLKTKGKMSSLGTWSKSGGNKSVGSVAGTRLSMYSLDTLRINLKPKKSKDRSSGGTSKMRRTPRRATRAPPHSPAARAPTHGKTARKRSPRFRRPLMRDPDSGRSKSKRKIPRDNEIRTMVETVGTITCTSSRVSCDVTPLPPLKPQRRCKDSPRSVLSKTFTPRRSPVKKSESPSPTRKPLSPLTPKFKRRFTPHGLKDKNVKAALRNETQRCGSSSLSPKNDKKLAAEVQKPIVPEVKDTEVTEATSRSNAETQRSVCETRRSVDETPRSVGETCPESARSVTHSVAKRGEMMTSEKRCEIAAREKNKPCPESARSLSQSADKRGEMMTSEKRCEIAARERNKASAMSARCEVTRIVKQLCGGDTAGRNERVSGAKNAQLHCVTGSSPTQPSTPQLLRILEETIQKKVPKQLFQPTHKDKERFRMVFNIPEATTERLFQYRTKFVQHMLTSPMYANSVVGKPWEVISRISDQIIDDLLATCAKEIQLEDTLQRMYNTETR